MRESVIQAEILKEIGALPWLRVWRNNTGALKDQRGQLITFGLKGSADIFGVMAPDGRFLAIEVKTPKGRQSEPQRAFEKMVTAMGGIYILARSVDDVYKALKLKE
jgi:hypothetical protein